MNSLLGRRIRYLWCRQRPLLRLRRRASQADKNERGNREPGHHRAEFAGFSKEIGRSEPTK
jgi:hypothetical protein